MVSHAVNRIIQLLAVNLHHFPSDDSECEENEERRRRKRKRRSRWAPESVKVEIPPVVIPNNPPPPIAGIAAPQSLGNVVPVSPPTQDRKLPGNQSFAI